MYFQDNNKLIQQLKVKSRTKRNKTRQEKSLINGIIIEIINTFPIPNTTYKGINTLVKNSNGYIFELQFHTYQSLKIKEENHKLYEKSRLSSTSTYEKIKLNGIMRKNSNKIIIPSNVNAIKNKVMQNE